MKSRVCILQIFGLSILLFGPTSTTLAAEAAAEDDFTAFAEWIGTIDVSTTNLVTAVTPWSGINIKNCASDTLQVWGWRSRLLKPGKILIYRSWNSQLCESCSPLLRRIVSVVNDENVGFKGLFSRTVHTEFITLQDILVSSPPEKDTHNSQARDGKNATTALSSSAETTAFNLMKTAMEPLFDCVHSGGSRHFRRTAEETPPLFPQKCEPGNVADSDWFNVNAATGQCDYTNCCLGPNPLDPQQCLSDGVESFNGCGAEGSLLSFSGDLLAFSFAGACCHHDICYSSPKYEKSRCDGEFYRLLQGSCPKAWIPAILFGIPCQVLSLVFFFLVAAFGDTSFDRGQAEQTTYESTPICRQCVE